MDKQGIFYYKNFVDLYGKALRDYEKIQNPMSLNADNIFNFLCTLDHLLDWAKEDESLTAEARNEASEMEDKAKSKGDKSDKSFVLYTIRGLCNSSKHFVRRKSDTEIKRKTKIISGPFGFGPFGMGPFGMVVYSFEVERNGATVPFLDIAKEAMDVWKIFYRRHLESERECNAAN